MAGPAAVPADVTAADAPAADGAVIDAPAADGTATDAPSVDAPATDAGADASPVDVPPVTDVVDAPALLDVPRADVVTADVPPVTADAPADVCAPRCTGRVCGDDGCGGTCAPGCPAGQTCTASTGLCATREAVWTGRSLPTSPTGRNLATMAYDSARGVTVLFGGDSTSATYDATTWEYQVPATP